jgi:predicted aminopeptidase
VNALRATALASVVLFAAGCSGLGYYYQAARGQFALSHDARPLPVVLSDPATSPDLRARLETARAIRDYASTELKLPDNDSYRKYADLKRPFVVWNVFAAPEFSIRAREWCFPVAGCVGYKGWFDQQSAESFADTTRHEGYDVFVYGVPAYSTLGWFDDPLLNTFIHYPRTELARLIFHELAHQVAYADGDSTFNESFATAVELEGVRRWLSRNGSEAERAEFEAMQVRKRDFVDLVERTRARLNAVYTSKLDLASMRSAKAAEFARMRSEYESLRERPLVQPGAGQRAPRFRRDLHATRAGVRCAARAFGWRSGAVVSGGSQAGEAPCAIAYCRARPARTGHRRSTMSR